MAVPKILFPTDFSSAASSALPEIKERIRIKAAEVHLLYVAEDLKSFEKYWGSGPDSKHSSSLADFAERRSRERLHQRAGRAAGHLHRYTAAGYLSARRLRSP